MRILIIGAGGRLGAALTRNWRDRFDLLPLSHADLDLSDLASVDQQLSASNFDVLINCAAMTSVDLCERKRQVAFRINADAPELLAQICDRKGARFIHFSTDYVFDGEKRSPYVEEDAAEPISVYGESKHEGEEKVLAVNERHLVVRVSWVFGPERPSFVDNIIARAKENTEVTAVADKLSTPTYTEDIASALPQFFSSDVGGLLHFANQGQCSWQVYAQFALDCCRQFAVPLKARTVGALKLGDMKDWSARRPVYSVLSTAKFSMLAGQSPRDWREAVREYIGNNISK